MKSFFSRRRSSSDNKETGSEDTSAPVPVAELITQGNALEDAGDAAGALELYERAASADPQSWRAHLNAGNALRLLARSDDAANAYRRSIRIHPEFAGGHLNLGNVLIADPSSISAAAESYRNATRLRPDWAEAWFGLGCALERVPDSNAAIAAYREALKHEPNHAKSCVNLAGLLRKAGESRAARMILAEILQRDPGYVPALLAQAELFKQSGDSESAVEAYRKVLDITPDDDAIASTYLFALNFVPGIRPETVLAEHRKFGDSITRRVATLPSRAPTRTHDRLRIGYVSPDFRRHSVSCFMEPLLRHHDRSNVEVHCYYNHAQRDDITERLIELSDHWHEIEELDDESVARNLRADEIDVLVDLAGHTTGNRLGIFARKPAPIQVTWLGYLCTTGLEAIDYRLCDGYTDPVGLSENWQVETPLRMPDSQWCYQPQVTLPTPSALPRLANGHWTFGSFNQSSKLNQQLLDDWAQLLRGIPDSRLRLVGIADDTLEERIRTTFAARDIAAERVEIVGRIPIESYFECYRDVDIALDSFPYNGATTTCDALLMGVPVASICGDRAITRGGLSLLSTVGLSDWVAQSSDDIVELLRGQTRDVQRIANLRADLPARMRASPLMDGPRFARNTESLFREAWQRQQTP
ncbi:MAG: tetratricopeptide repeat protein [Rhodanobacteraceae bacterium]